MKKKAAELTLGMNAGIALTLRSAGIALVLGKHFGDGGMAPPSKIEYKTSQWNVSSNCRFLRAPTDHRTALRLESDGSLSWIVNLSTRGATVQGGVEPSWANNLLITLTTV